MIGFLRRVPPPLALLYAILPGMALIALSHIAGVHSFQYEGQERGYVAAVNWSVNFTIMLALLVFFMASAYQSIPRIAERLARSGMVRDRTAAHEPITDPAVISTVFERKLDRTSVFIFLGLLFGAMWSIYEFITTSIGPLFWGWDVPVGEIDWAMDALYPHATQAGRKATAAFAALAFSLQALLIGLLTTFVVFVVSFALAVTALSTGNMTLRPNLRSEDSRLGFQIFEDLATTLLLASSVIYGMFYLTRVWNAFLDPHNAESSTIIEFAATDIVKGFGDGFGQGLSKAFETTHFDQSGAIVTLAAPIVFMIVFMAIAIVLRNAARDARDSAFADLEELPDDGLYNGLTKTDAAARLRGMVFWPVSYPGPNMLLSLIIFALACLVFFRLGLVYIGIVLAIAVSNVSRETKRLDGQPAP